MPNTGISIEELVRDLPDPEGARLFFDRITTEHPRTRRTFEREPGLLSDALALAAWSPLLGTTLTQNPDYLSWLARERSQTRVRTTEEFKESLARFALTHSQLDPQVFLARFRRRELLRIYLLDARRVSTIVETTEELSNLADAVLQHALGIAQQELDNLYGSPLHTDARGRRANATFCIVALGKLGSRELNYASDIDLLFLYSDDGSTSGSGVRDAVTNAEYFGKLAERVARIVGNPSGEGAAYRVDLRLRPYGRDGALSSSLAAALRYYRETAQAWELQTLIRSRAAAGSAELYARFAEEVRDCVYRTDVTVARALAHVRLAKQKIDRHHGKTRGFNVKLGRGGIREIEFIAQALQLAYGARVTWLQAPHTLISLGRLADRGFISERERSELSDAYAFLRALEHRLQMEHGLQTHTVPEDAERRALVARRMNFTGPTPLAAFDAALELHTTNVRAAYDRVFATVEEEIGEATETACEATVGTLVQQRSQEPQAAQSATTPDHPRPIFEAPADVETASALTAASLLAPRIVEFWREKEGVERLAQSLRATASASLNARRALTLVARVAASLDKSELSVNLSRQGVAELVRVCGASEYFGEMLASNPALIPALTSMGPDCVERDHRALLRASIDRETSFGAELSALRRTWARLLVELGACDVRGNIPASESNRLQTHLAQSSINVGLLVARRELVRRYGNLRAGPRPVVLGLGRLGSGGIDYGSDLDIVIVYDELVPSPVPSLTCDEAYARMVELLVAALSSITRDGYLYRVDMRLRPDGRNGVLAMSAGAFINYLTERASVWEWLAYVKLRAVAGDLEFGRSVEERARRAVHEAARRAGAEALRAETRRIRERLERERTARAQRTTDIKFGAGGMLDVYFAVRFLQLRDDVPDEPGDRSTQASLARLHAAGSLADEDYRALADGYALLRRLDHHLRLIAGRSTRLPAGDHPVTRDLARATGYDSAAALSSIVEERMTAIRAAYDCITAG